jgi:hypothetical protein
MAKQHRYEIRAEGWIGERWADWFDGVTITYECAVEGSPVTVLTALVPDQAALRSLLTKIWGLNLTVISVERIEAVRE